MEIIYKENLSRETIRQYENLLGEFYFEEYTDMKSGDYIFMIVRSEDKIYKIVHGFPGDQPMGIVFNEDGIIEYLPPEDNLTSIGKWYEDCMADCECEKIIGTGCPRNHRDSHYWFFNRTLPTESNNISLSSISQSVNTQPVILAPIKLQ
jgi:hypothetical protein